MSGKDIFKGVLKIFKTQPKEKFNIESISGMLGTPFL